MSLTRDRCCVNSDGGHMAPHVSTGLKVSEDGVGKVRRLVQAEREGARCRSVEQAELVQCATIYLLFYFRPVVILKLCIRKYLLYF